MICHIYGTIITLTNAERTRAVSGRLIAARKRSAPRRASCKIIVDGVLLSARGTDAAGRDGTKSRAQRGQVVEAAENLRMKESQRLDRIRRLSATAHSSVRKLIKQHADLSLFSMPIEDSFAGGMGAPQAEQAA
jgi:hypothetical protein